MPGLGLGLNLNSQGAGFSPPDLSGLALYLRADSQVDSDAAAKFVTASNQYLNAGATNRDQFNVGTGHFTIACWVYVDSLAADNNIVTKSANLSAGRSYYLRILATSGNIFFSIADPASGGDSGSVNVNQDTNPMVAGRWFFIVARYDGSNIILRHYDTNTLPGGDVQQKQTAHSTGAFNNTTIDFLVGSYSSPPNTTLDGRVDSVGVWKGKALSDAECDALWNAGNGLAYSDLTAAQKTSLLSWYDMNEASGVRFDSHSNGYDLTAVNSPVAAVGIPSGIADDEDAISLWRDQSDSANDASQTAALLRPTFQSDVSANGKPAILSDGSDDILAITGLSIAAGDFLIAWVESFGGASVILADSARAGDFISHTSATNFRIGEHVATTDDVTHADISTGLHISMLARTSGVMTYYLDGTSHSTVASTASWALDRIGVIDGHLAELIVIVGSNPSDSVRNALGAYLAGKYGLAWTP